jgi:Aldo/keto reductase family
MEHRTLGRTGVKVSPLCLGAMMFGGWGESDYDESIRIIHRALDAGINFVDTADIYSGGESEEIVGKAVADGRRDNVILATKVHDPMGDDPNERGNSRRWIVRAVENSLRRLRTDWIDLYQIHRPELDTDIDETLGAPTDLVRAGKVRYIGSSTFPASEIVEAQWTAERRCKPSAERPCFWLVSCQIATNQDESGVRVPASSVPAVTELWRSQARQTQRPRFGSRPVDGMSGASIRSAGDRALAMQFGSWREAHGDRSGRVRCASGADHLRRVGGRDGRASRAVRKFGG